MLGHFRTMQFTCALYVDTTISMRIAICKVFCQFRAFIKLLLPQSAQGQVKSAVCELFEGPASSLCYWDWKKRKASNRWDSNPRAHELFIHTALQLCYYRYLWQIRVNYILAKLLKVTNNSMALKMAPSLKQAWGMVDIHYKRQFELSEFFS